MKPLLATLLATGFLSLPSLPLRAAECEVNPYQAYQTAQPRGWSFRCLIQDGLPGSVLSATLLPEPPNRIGCRIVTGPPSPITPSVALRFFSRFNSTAYPSGGLRNGWRIHRYELSGGNYSDAPDDTARLRATIMLPNPNRTLDYRLSRLILSHPTEGCANVLDRAF